MSFTSVAKKLTLAVALPGAAIVAVGAFTVDRHAWLPAAALCACVVVASGLATHQLVVRRLKVLAAAMRRAEGGDLLARAEVDQRDEIGALANAFNRLLARMTSMKVDEIDTHRDLEAAQARLALQRELEQHKMSLEHRVNELSLLYDVARSLTATLELPELFARITRLVTERLGMPRFSIMLSDGHGALEVRHAFPAGRGTEGLVFRVGEGICGRAARSMRPMYVSEVDHDANFLERGTSEARRPQSLLCLPMVHGGTLLGVLNFERYERDGFEAEEIELLSAVTGQAAMAVKNAQLHAQTVELSITDPLTGIPNRRHLFSQLDAEIARANRFGTQLSFLMIDIDHFKRLNDLAGHQAGDTVLREVCERINTVVRRVDTFARYGGEEFALLLPQVTKAEALEVAEKLRRLVSDTPFTHGKVQPTGRVTISVGLASLPVDAVERDRLVDAADSALYASKRDGRNRVTGYAPGMELHPGRERGPYSTKRPVAEPATDANVAVVQVAHQRR